MLGVELLICKLVFCKAVGKVEPIDQSGGVHPAISSDVVTGGRKSVVRRHPHGFEGLDQGSWIRGIGCCGAEGRGDEFEGVLTLFRKYCFELNSGELSSVRRIALISPSVASHVSVMRSTRGWRGDRPQRSAEPACS